MRRRLVGRRNRKNHWRRSGQRRGSSLEVKEIEQEEENDGK